MEIKVITGDITKIEAGAIIVDFFEGMKQPEGETLTLDKALDGAISQLVSQGEIKGKLNEITLVHSLGKLASARVAVVGLGKKEALTPDKVRNAVAETCRCLRQKNVDNIATIAQGAWHRRYKPEERCAGNNRRRFAGCLLVSQTHDQGSGIWRD